MSCSVQEGTVCPVGGQVRPVEGSSACFLCIVYIFVDPRWPTDG